MEDFERHEGWCPLGQPANDVIRLDLFPEYGDPLPVWHKGDGCAELARTWPSALREALRQWNRDWENAATSETAEAGGSQGRAWLNEGDRLGEWLAAETGAVVVVLGPERSGGADCRYCGPNAPDSE